MVQLQKLKPSIPNLATKPTTFYIASIFTGPGEGEAHYFAFLVEHRGLRNRKEVSIVLNEVGFEMAHDTIFVIDQAGTTRLRGKQIPAKWLVPAAIPKEEIPDERMFRPPDGFRGRTIPTIEPEEEEELALELFESAEVRTDSWLEQYSDETRVRY